MPKSSQNAEKNLAQPAPYDSTTLQQRIRREIVGISALSDLLANYGTHNAGPTPKSSIQAPPQESRMDMIRVRLDDEFWVDMTPEQVDGFLRRKETSLQAVEERRENLAQLQEWMIRELQNMDGRSLEGNPEVEESDDISSSVEHYEPVAAVESQVSARNAQTVSQPDTETPVNNDVDPSPNTAAAALTTSQSTVTKETIQQLEDINSALAKFGTSMEEVLKLDDQAGSKGQAGAAASGTEVGTDGTVLNEEGLPFLDIREDPSQPSDGTAVKQPVPSASPASVQPVDDYWSDEAVERRRKLRERLLGSDDDDDEEEEEEEGGEEGEGQDVKDDEAESIAEDSDDAPDRADEIRASATPAQTTTTSNASQAKPIPLPEPETASQPERVNKGKGKAPLRKPGFMARSIVIDHSTEKTTDGEDEDAPSKKTPILDTPRDNKVDGGASSAKVPSTTPVVSPPPSLKTAEAETTETTERRKSVTFNPQTRVRLYEKGEAMPAPSPAPADTGSGSRFELLPDDQEKTRVQSNSSVPSSPSTVNNPAAVGGAAKGKDSGTFAGFKKGFLDSGPAKKQDAKTDQKPSAAAPTASSTTPASTAKPPAAAFPEPTIVESPEYHQPLAPAHEKPTRTKKQSLFAQRKAEAQNKREQLMNFSSFAPMAVDPVGTGAPVNTKPKEVLSNPMKMAVVERPVAPAKPPGPSQPASSPIPTRPSSQPFPPNMKKSRDASVTADGTPKTGSKLNAVKDSVTERKAAPTSKNTETTVVESSAHPNDSDSDSLADFEYSDGEDAFDMDEALLAREAALAYHAKRSELGRKGLGGWTGHIGPDGEVEWDTEIVPMSAGMDEAPPRTGPVAFGEQIIPLGLENFSLPVGGDDDKDSEDGDDANATDEGFSSISLPQVIPASENLASSIKIGKLENGNLIVQDTDDSDEEAEDELTRPDAALTVEQQTAREQAAEERRQRKAMIDRLRSGNVAEMIREEQEREEMFRKNGGGYVEPPREEPPALVQSVPPSIARSAARKDIVPATGIVPSLPNDDTKQVEEDARPKKVSRFKAARMAAN